MKAMNSREALASPAPQQLQADALLRVQTFAPGEAALRRREALLESRCFRATQEPLLALVTGAQDD